MPVPRNSDYPRDPRNTMPSLGNIPSLPNGRAKFTGGSAHSGPQAQMVRNLDGHLVDYYGADSGYIPEEDIVADDDNVSFIDHDQI